VSYIKAFEADRHTLTYRAACAAWEETAALRMAALTRVFEDCGTAAKVYADPRRVTQILVSAVTKEYMRCRKTTAYRVAG
jgi:hypothetical protein